jgi:hypothetical protein
MLSGFNTNVRHRGVLFHVQTEDSGRAHPHVITHLYHGGTILASEKRGYADRVDQPDLPGSVKALMESQHGAMLERLRSGELDDVIADRLGDAVFSAAKGTAGGAGNTMPAPGAEPGTAVPIDVTAPRKRPPRPPSAPPARREPRPPDRPDRPLDELILDYLVEATRQRRSRPE